MYSIIMLTKQSEINKFSILTWKGKIKDQMLNTKKLNSNATWQSLKKLLKTEMKWFYKGFVPAHLFYLN